MIATVGVSLVALILTACSSSSGGSSGSGGSGGSTASGGGGSSSKDDIVVYNINADTGIAAEPTFFKVLNAEASSVNDAGGIDGHKVKLVNCDDQGNVNLDTQCAEKAVKAHAVAVLQNIANGAAILGVSARSKVPEVSFYLGYPLEGTSPYSFPLQGAVTVYASMGEEMYQHGCKKAGVLVNTGAPPNAVVGPIDAALESHGLPDAKYVGVDPTAASADAPVASLIAQGVDCIANIASEGTGTVSGTLAIRHQKPSIKVFLQFGQVSPQILTQFGADGVGIVVTGASYTNYDTNQPGVQTVLAAVKKYEPGTELNGFAPNVWATLQVALQGAKVLLDKGQDLTGQNETDALNTLKDFKTGMLAPTTFTAAGSGIPLEPRLFNFGWLGWTIAAGGKLTLLTSDFEFIPHDVLVTSAKYLNKMP